MSARFALAGCLLFWAALIAAIMSLAGCTGYPDKFGIETPPFGTGEVPHKTYRLTQGEVISYCVSIDGRLFDHGRACVKTDYTLTREVSRIPTWCVAAHVAMPDAEAASVSRYVSAICSGWSPLA